MGPEHQTTHRNREMAVKYVLFYDVDQDVTAKVRVHFPAHSDRFAEFHTQGTLLLGGPFDDPQKGAMAIFTTRIAAEEFALGDPFVLAGLVQNWYIREWNEVLTEP